MLVGLLWICYFSIFFGAFQSSKCRFSRGSRKKMRGSRSKHRLEMGQLGHPCPQSWCSAAEGWREHFHLGAPDGPFMAQRMGKSPSVSSGLWPWKVWLVKFTGNPDYPLLNDYDHPQVYIYILGSLLSYRPGFWTLRTTAWWSPKSCIWDHQNLTESSAWISKKNGLWYSPRPWVYPLVIKHGLLERPLLTSMIFPAINHDLSGISQLATLDYRKLNGLELPWWIVKCHSMPIYTTLNPTKPH